MSNFEGKLMGGDIGSLDAVLTLSRIGYDTYRRAPCADTLLDAIHKLQLARRLIRLAIASPRTLPGRCAPELKLQGALQKRLGVVDRRLAALVKRADGIGIHRASYRGDDVPRPRSPNFAGQRGSSQHPRWVYQQKHDIARRMELLEGDMEGAAAQRNMLVEATAMHAAAESGAACKLADAEAEAQRVELLHDQVVELRAQHDLNVQDLELRAAELRSGERQVAQQALALKAGSSMCALAVQAERTKLQAEAERAKAVNESTGLIRQWHDRQTTHADLRAMLVAHRTKMHRLFEQGKLEAEQAQIHMKRMETAEAALQTLQTDLGIYHADCNDPAKAKGHLATPAQLRAAITMQMHYHKWRARSLVRALLQACAARVSRQDQVAAEHDRRAAAAAFLQAFHRRRRAHLENKAVARSQRQAFLLRLSEESESKAVECTVAALIQQLEAADQLARHQDAAAKAAAEHAAELSALKARTAQLEAQLAIVHFEHAAQKESHTAELEAIRLAAEAKERMEKQVALEAAARQAAAKKIQSTWRQRCWGQTIKKMLQKRRESEAAAAAEQERMRMEHEAQAARVRAEAQKLLNAAQEEAAQLKQQEERSRQQAQELAAKLEAEKQAREAEIRAQQDQVEKEAAQKAEEVRQLIESGGPAPSAGREEALDWAAKQNATELLQLEHATAWLSLLQGEMFEGWLLKRGAKGFVKSWKRRYFVLNSNNALEYFTTDAKTEKKGEVDLHGCLKVRPVEASKERPFELELVFDSRLYRLAAEDQQELCQWLAMLASRYTVATPVSSGGGGSVAIRSTSSKNGPSEPIVFVADKLLAVQTPAHAPLPSSSANGEKREDDEVEVVVEALIASVVDIWRPNDDDDRDAIGGGTRH